MYDDVKGLLAKLHLLCDSTDQNVAPDGQTGHTVKNLQSVDFGLFKMKEMLHECSNMLQHLPQLSKFPASKLVKDANNTTAQTSSSQNAQSTPFSNQQPQARIAASSLGGPLQTPFQNSTSKHNNWTRWFENIISELLIAFNDY